MSCPAVCSSALGLRAHLPLTDRILVMGTRPGRIVEGVRVDLPRPREADAVRARREFATMREHLWSLLSQGDKTA
jgi:NitT/TauT family transport system ATP-binding protein